MYHCKWQHCGQRFVTEAARDDHELAARHWDDVEARRRTRPLALAPTQGGSCPRCNRAGLYLHFHPPIAECTSCGAEWSNVAQFAREAASAWTAAHGGDRDG